MKLIDLLVKELPKRGGWPKKITSIGQDYDRELMFYGVGKPRTGIILDELAADHRKRGDSDKGVTRAEYESALAKNDGWIEWGGGECPVDGVVDVKLRNGHITTNRKADSLDWNHYTPDGGGAIITYRPHRDINSHVNDDRLEQDLNECIGQDVDMPEWYGEGLPPVGTICEALMPALNHETWHWRTVKVVESGIPGAEKEVLAYDIENTKPAWTDEFRPLRTEAEKARESSINDIALMIGRGTFFQDAERIYDAISSGEIKVHSKEEK